MADTYETLTYRQKQALHFWKASLGDAALSLQPEAENLVWDILVLCTESILSPSPEIDEEVAGAARELADLVLDSADVDTLYTAFRDRLIEAIMKHLPMNTETAMRMVHFSNLLSDAYREAYSANLQRRIAHQRSIRLSEELQMAKRIQERLLPKRIPHIPGFQFAGRLIPAREVGGDYWSVKYYPDDGVVTTKLADISGHGIAAATLVAAVKFVSGGYYRGAKSASEVIERTNRIMVMETPVEILVTMVYGWLHPKKRIIDVVNAGHEPAFLCKDNACLDIKPTGPVLGIEETKYGEIRLQLDPGDIIVFCSDGITEAGITEQFGLARVKEIVLANRKESADRIADNVIQAVTDFAGQPHDDVSILVIKTLDETA